MTKDQLISKGLVGILNSSKKQIKKFDLQYYTFAVYSWSIANNFVIGFYCRCLEIIYQIAFSSLANYFRADRKKQFGIKSVGIYSGRL